MAHNLLRAAVLGQPRSYAKARGGDAPPRPHRRSPPAPPATAGAELALHLPEGWHREREWLNLWEAACGPPPAAAG